MVTSAQAYWLNRKRRQKRAASEGVGVAPEPVLPSNRLVAGLGDSRISQATGIASPSAIVTINNGFHIYWAQGLSLGRCRTIAAHNIATAGWTTAQMLAAVGDVIATGAGTCVVLGSTNDDEEDDSTGNLAAIIAALRAEDIVVILCNEMPRGDTTYPAMRFEGSRLAKHLAVRDWCSAQHSPSSGVYVADTFGAIAVPDSPTGDAVVGATRDGLHQSIGGALTLGRVVSAIYDQLWDYDPTVKPSSDSDPRLLSANPFMTGTGGGIVAGATGSMAASHTFNRATNANGLAWTVSKVDVDSQNDVQRYTTGGTPAATGAVDLTRQQNLHSGLGADKYAEAVLHVIIGAGLVNIRGIFAGLRMIGAQDNWHCGGWMPGDSDTIVLDEPVEMIIRSPRPQNPGSLTNLWLRPGSYPLGGAAGSGSFDILCSALLQYDEA